jgi:hypothetical protein
MKPKLILFAACISASLYSCNKNQDVKDQEPIIENNGLYGKWRLIEVFPGYANGGDFKWHKIDLANSHSLEFNFNGDFTRIGGVNEGSPVCTGTYQVFPDTKIRFYANCNVFGWVYITESTNTSLIFDQQGIEGPTRYKYKPEK